MALSGYGLLPTGLRVPSRATIREDFNADVRGQIGTSLDLSDDVPLGQYTGLLCDRLHLLWLLMLVLYKSNDRDQAAGAALEALCMLTGTLRSDAQPSTVALTLTGTPTTVVAASSVAKAASTGSRWKTVTDATIAAVPAWASNTAYAVGARVHSNGLVFECKLGGTSVNPGTGPGFATPTPESNQPPTVTDGTVTWWRLGAGTGAIDVDAHSEATGAIVALSPDISAIDTPVSGWSAVVNVVEAAPGRAVATDQELRQAADADVFRPAGGSPDAIRQALLAIVGVESVSVYYNPDSAPSFGVPAHTVWCVVAGGDDTVIAETLFAAVCAGIGTMGNTTVSVDDSEGTAHDVYFSRPDDIPIYVEVDLDKVAAAAATPNIEAYPSDGNDQVAAAVVARGNALRVGGNVYGGKLAAAAEDIAGVLGVTEVRIGTAPGPVTTTPITIEPYERAVFALNRVLVTSSDGDV